MLFAFTHVKTARKVCNLGHLTSRAQEASVEGLQTRQGKRHAQVGQALQSQH